MKKLPRYVTVFGLMTALALTSALAAEGPKAKIFAKYDTNKNGVLDGDEIEAVRKAYAAEPKGEFARYDANHDGKLDDKEIAEIKPPGAKKDGEKKGGGKKKAEPEKTEKK
jgi:Ca2+-binding EF-hand superfamily protein